MDQHEKTEVSGYFDLRPELAGELSAPMHRTDKLPMIICSNLYDWFNLWFSPQCVTLCVSKKQASNKLTAKPLMIGKRKKEDKNKKKVLHCGQEGIKEIGDIDWRHRNSQKEKTVEQKEIVAWQPVTLSDDTLPTVLGTVNKCVCEMLWRMFCTKETKCQCVVQWQPAQLAK